jgi:ribonuclease HI
MDANRCYYVKTRLRPSSDGHRATTQDTVVQTEGRDRKPPRTHVPCLDGRLVSRSGWVIRQDAKGEGPAITQGARNLGSQETAFDAEVAAIEQVIAWFHGASQRHMLIHSDSTSAIARATHTGAGPGQTRARNIRNMICEVRHQGKTADLIWVKGHQSTPGNERADALAGRAAEKMGYSKTMSIAHLKLRISEKFRREKETWHKTPSHHGIEEKPPPPPKKPCLDSMRNSIARTVAQIRTGHWRSTVYIKRTRKIAEDKRWFASPLPA